MIRLRQLSRTKKMAAGLLPRDGQMQFSDGLIYQFARFAAMKLRAPSVTAKRFHDGQQYAIDL
jgi:hypothetical protein